MSFLRKWESSKIDKQYYVYILASQRNGTLYIGVTTDLEQRIQKHRFGLYKGFSKKYKVYLLVYYEVYLDIRTAIQREKRLKKWERKWKLRLIEESNPEWSDLYPGFPPARE